MSHRLLIALFLAGLLTACQMPQPRTGTSQPAIPSIPTSTPSPSGSSGSPSTPTPSGSPASSGPAGSTESGDMSAGDNLPAGAGSDQLPMPGAEYPSSANDGTSVEGLDAQLDEALGDFDETVMGQSSASNEDSIDILNPRGGGSSGLESGEPLFEEGDPGDDGDPVENDELAQRAAGGASGGGGAGATTNGAGGSRAEGGEPGTEEIVPIPDDIGDGRSDDIVLRQVRDAAMKESDPVLREKLWDEYRRIRDQR